MNGISGEAAWNRRQGLVGAIWLPWSVHPGRREELRPVGGRNRATALGLLRGRVFSWAGLSVGDRMTRASHHWGK